MHQNPILLIDDSKVVRAHITDVLNRNGYYVQAEKDGKSGLDTAKKNYFDLILLDVVLPDINGFNLIKSLKSLETNKHTPIIFLTGVVDQDNLVQGLTLGANDYITKPFCEEILLARIETQLKLKSTLEQLEKEIKENQVLVKIAERHNKDLLNANMYKEKILAILAHDIKNPINSISGMTNLLLKNYEHYPPERVKEVLNIIHASVPPINDLINNVLVWTNKKKIKNSYNPKVLMLKSIVDKCIEINQVFSETKDVTIASTIEGNTSVYADENMVSAIIRNLLSNAIKFNRKGGKIFISNHELNIGEIKYTEVSIEDTGIGILPNKIPNLFGSKDVHSNNGTNKETGIGLGLKLCKEYVEVNLGKIRVESSKGEGSKFMFTLPVQPIE